LDAEATKGVLSPGLKLRHYEIRKVIGQGGFGITYLARDTTLHRDVAIKEYLPTALALREGGETVVPRSTATANDFLSGRERFLDEARTLAKLDHMPSVVRVLDFLEANGTAYMVMALARGETLAVRLQRDGPLDPAALDRLLPPLLDGLEEVHGAGFLHRDIKPANILVDQRGIPTLIDFGAARAALAGSSVAMTAIFTPGYAAPEQFTSARQGPWTDIYGLAATLYQAITGKTPPSAFDRILDDTYEPLSRVARGDWRRGLVAGIDGALSVHAAERPQTIAQWRRTLMADPVGDRTVKLPAPEAAAATVRAAPRRRSIGYGKTVWIGGGVLVLLLLAGGGYFLLAPKAVVEAEKTLADVDKEVERARAALVAAEAVARRRAEEDRQRLAEIESKRKTEAEAAERKRQEEEAQRSASAQTARDREAAEAARLRAEADAAAKRQADEEEAKRRADVEAKAKRQADAEIQRARDAVAAAEAARQKAEDEAARLRADAAKRQAEADALRLQQAEAAATAEKKRLDEEARQKADAAVAADKKRLDDDAARQKADAEAARRQSDEVDRKTAEAAETALRLGPADRQRLQVALTSQGFDTRGADGAFGARSREMIAAWQKARGMPSTGFLTAAQQQALLREAAPAVARFDDEEKKKADEAKRKAEEEAKARAAAPTAPVPAAPAPAATPAGRDGLWFGALDCKTSGRVSVQGNVAGGAGSLSGGNRTLRVQITGDSMTISVSTLAGAAGQTGGPVGGGSGTMSGKLSGRGVYAQGSVGGDPCTVSLVGP
jgi:peptidoglycan hydrolase-like protein with peptidoglycan-binding domain